MRLWVLLAVLLLAMPAAAQQVSNPMSQDGFNASADAKANIGLDSAKNYYGYGDALYPIYATKTTTTGNATSGSPTITVASATGIAVGDLIEAAFVPAGFGLVSVVSVAGTTVTMSTNATANATGASVSFGNDRFQSKNTVMTNVLASQTGLFGTAARGHSTWVSKFHPWTDLLSWATIHSISPIGQSAGFFASRTSDNPSAGSFTIPMNCFMVGDRPTADVFSWCLYLESRLLASAAPTNHIQIESSIDNHWTIGGDEDPYNVNPGAGTLPAVRNLRLDNGLGYGTLPLPKVATAAMDIINNNGQYRSGIVFDATAFDMSDLRPFASAIAMAAKHANCWYLNTSGGIPNWCIWADMNAAQSWMLTDVDGNQPMIEAEQTTKNLHIGRKDNTAFVIAHGTTYMKPPTSCAGVPSGSLWNNAGTPAICP